MSGSEWVLLTFIGGMVRTRGDGFPAAHDETHEIFMYGRNRKTAYEISPARYRDSRSYDVYVPAEQDQSGMIAEWRCRGSPRTSTHSSSLSVHFVTLPT
jgi:hypothetical protein